MLKRNVQYEKSATGIRLRKFGLALAASRPSLSRASQLIFLCGANRAEGGPSARREAIKRFVEGLSPDNRVLYAEGVFQELSKIGHNKNVLDLEHEISAIADKIVIILESPSAFCELGAFAHPTLRKKLIVINDQQFRKAESFINTGPVAALTEADSPVLWYPMTKDGVWNLDGIGATFSALKAAVTPRVTTGVARISANVSDLGADKTSLYFVHDLVLFTGPISYDELISVLIAAFGDKPYDMLKRLLGVLRAAGLVQSYMVDGVWLYRSKSVDAYLTYGANVSSLIATFRRYHLRLSPKRFADVQSI